MCRSFAQPGAQLLSDILQAGGNVGAGPLEQWQMARRMGHMRDGVALARLVLRLDARSLRLFTALYLHPLLSTQQLAIVLSVLSTSVARTLRRLRHLDLVHRQLWGVVHQCMLTDRGVLLLARCAHLPGCACASLDSGEPPRALQRYQREVRSLTRTPEHTEGVYSFFIALLQSYRAERAQGHDAALLWWETGARRTRAFHEAGSWQMLRPDGAGEWRIEAQRFRFWFMCCPICSARRQPRSTAGWQTDR